MENLCGIIVVNKPEKFTSFDVIAKMRGMLKTKKLGHSGTLDPMATGVLPVFIGKATKACDMIPDNKKSYEASFKFGVMTDTEDVWGKVLKEDYIKVSEEALKSALADFMGEIYQTPPMYSAVKVNGKKLYELARKGEVVEREKRKITINSIDLLEYDENTREGTLKIDCSKGTYVRTIISDLGKKLNTLGIMTSLVRTYSTGFSIDEAFTLEQIQKLCDEEKIEKIILPLDKAFNMYPKIILSDRNTKLFKNGVLLRDEQVNLYDKNTVRVYSERHEFLSLASLNEDNLFKSKKNFY